MNISKIYRKMYINLIPLNTEQYERYWSSSPKYLSIYGWPEIRTSDHPLWWKKNRINAKENGPRDVDLSRREKLLRRTIKWFYKYCNDCSCIYK